MPSLLFERLQVLIGVYLNMDLHLHFLGLDLKNEDKCDGLTGAVLNDK